MSSVIAEYNRRQIYSHPHSQAERAQDAARKAPPGPVAQTTARHADEVSELHRRHGSENTKLRERHTSIRENWEQRNYNAQMPHGDVKAMKAEIDKLKVKHEDEAAALRSKHRKEMEKAVKANPLP